MGQIRASDNDDNIVVLYAFYMEFQINQYSLSFITKTSSSINQIYLAARWCVNYHAFFPSSKLYIDVRKGLLKHVISLK